MPRNGGTALQCQTRFPGASRLMSEDGTKLRWWIGAAAPFLVAVATWVLNGFDVRSAWSWTTDLFGAIPAAVYWVLSLVAAFAAGQMVRRSREPSVRDTEAQEAPDVPEAASEVVAEAEVVVEPRAVIEAEAVTDANAEPEWVTEAEARDLVRESNYWSRIKRRRALDQLEAKFEYEEYGIEPEPEPLEIETAAIAPPRHTPDIDSVLQHFWDDNPAARRGGLYHRHSLLDWLEDQALDVDLPNL